VISLTFSLIAALGYGLSDFVGGVTSRRTSAWPVAFLAAVGAAGATFGAAIFISGSPTGADLLWGGLAGVGSGLGGAFLYRGLANGRMGVVAPISAVGAALIPLPVALFLGERPTWLAWVGIALALPGIWLVSREPGAQTTTAGVVDGILAGLGFGFLFVFAGQIGSDAGLLPVALTQVVGAISVVITAVLMRQDWAPRKRVDLWGLFAGALAAGAMICFLFATHHGYLSIAAVVTSLYPAATIGLAALVLKERFSPSHALGMLLCLTAVVCVGLAS
jgi:drug/metabolite transporter (DMT)-like permease